QRFLELPLELQRTRRRHGLAAKVRNEVTQSLQNRLDDFGQIGGGGTGVATVRCCGGLGQEESCQGEQEMHRVRHTASFRWCWVSLQLPKGETPPFSRAPGGSQPDFADDDGKTAVSGAVERSHPTQSAWPGTGTSSACCSGW